MSEPTDSLSRPSFVFLIVTTVLVLASLITTPIPGTNEPHYLAKARATANTTWCVNDFFLQSANAHAVFFAIVGPFADTFEYQHVLIAGRVLVLLLLAAGLQSLCQSVGCDGRRTMMSVAMFFVIGATGNFSGEWVIGGFESKVPAYGFSLLSLSVLINNRHRPATFRYLIAGGLTGLAIALHPVVGMWTLICVCMTEFWLWVLPTTHSDSSLKGAASFFRRGTAYLTSAIVCSLPGLLPALQMLLASETELKTQQAAKQIQVFYRLAHHLDPTQFPAYSWWHTAGLVFILGVSVILLRRKNNPDRSNTSTSPVDQQESPSVWLLRFLLCTAIVAAAGIAIGWHDDTLSQQEGRHWRATLLQFYPFRLFDAFLPLTVAIFVSALPFLGRKRKPNSDSASTAAHGIIPFRSAGSTAVAMLLLTVTVASSIRPACPSGYSEATFEEWKKACGWLRKNTPKDSLIFAPRESFGLKLFAERAEYVCFKDCPQDAEGIVEWNRRLWSLHRWSDQAYRDRIYSQTDLTQLRKKTGIDFILTRRLGPFEVDPVWEGEFWKIYEVPAER